MLVRGKWTTDWQPVQAKDAKGGFVRQVSSFRNWVTADGTAGPTGRGGFKAEAGRYRLYVALICPWASRTLIGRALMGLEDAIPVTIVEPELSGEGWRFGAEADPVRSAAHLHELYTVADAEFTGRATVPILWDSRTGTIVNNESADILRMMATGFGGLATKQANLYPEHLRSEIDALSDWIYPRLNNGVYRAGFATTQVAYDEAVASVFETLETLEDRMSDGRAFLFGPDLTETDIRLFVTLVRFDAAYHGIFKCNIRRLADFPRLSGFLERVLDVPGVAPTVNLDQIKRGYYSIRALNPTGIVPKGPDLSWAARTARSEG